ncbi:MAG: class I SAM-dependent methyltransferase [Anaerolineales bacterium]
MIAMANHDLPLGHLNGCQLCGTGDLDLVLDLGHHPPCDSLLRADQLCEPERTYPLRFVRCGQCGLAQIDYVVAPEVLFHSNYPYRSGITATLVKHLEGTAQTVIEKFRVERGSLVIDIGSNDGTALQAFKARGMRVLGIEPTNVAKLAIDNGIPTIQEFFSESLARQIHGAHGPAAVVLATNMFAHVQKLGDMVRGVTVLLEHEGVFITESHYLLDLIQTVQYDSIYHEHLKYYSVRPLQTLLSCYKFTLVDVERISSYGGSIRVYAMKGADRSVSRRVDQLVADEERAGLYGGDVYVAFRERVVRSKVELQALLLHIRRRDHRVVGIACPGRSSTLLNYCNIDRDLMLYIAEQATSLKVGLFLPGKHIPIIDEKMMFGESPEYGVMLSWHYAGPIMATLRKKGLAAKFILPLPDVRVIEE